MSVASDPLLHFPRTAVHEIADLSDVRRAFGDWLAEQGFGAEQIGDLSVVLSELLANAVTATPTGAAPPTVHAALDRERLEIEVSNTVSPAVADAVERGWDLTDPLRTGGRGLLLVSAFVDDVDVDVEENRVVLRCVTDAVWR